MDDICFEEILLMFDFDVDDFDSQQIELR